ncbi:ubiquitin carboxyl-terminal hydrolase [Microplitis demolitor]|uniref:ubiquitin carboxyl-terminal hydrolase n=1 Tax=Microplitis demolitor TaxID=69319 RepID=UPI0004400202|nr:ubiquitin carboxyl-terminal hydrolase [Microplitis demolitor]
MALVPLESNPDVMTKFIHQIGVPSKWALHDVYGLDPELLAMVPKPALALILLYPESEKAQAYAAELEAKIKEEGREPPENVFHMQQCVPNACGTVALIHAILNNLDQIELEDGILKNFLEEAKDLSFVERGKLLMNTASEIIDAHEQLAQEGQTPAPQENAPVYHHFVAFIEKDGSLYELDGRKSIPINHGPTTKDTLLENAAKVCGEYMARDPEEVRFTMIALVASDQ